jgi:hypothetical protein
MEKGKSSVLHLAVSLPSKKMSKWLLRQLALLSSDLAWRVVDGDGLTPAQLAKSLQRESIYEVVTQIMDSQNE